MKHNHKVTIQNVPRIGKAINTRRSICLAHGILCEQKRKALVTGRNVKKQSATEDLKKKI